MGSRPTKNVEKESCYLVSTTVTLSWRSAHSHFLGNASSRVEDFATTQLQTSGYNSQPRREFLNSSYHDPSSTSSTRVHGSHILQTIGLWNGPEQDPGSPRPWLIG